jgi:hypothetical protein
MWVEKAAHVSPKMRVFFFFPRQHGRCPLQASKKEHKLVKSQQLLKSGLDTRCAKFTTQEQV